MEDQEEKEGTDWGELFGHAVRFMILCGHCNDDLSHIWIKSVMTELF